MGDWSGGQVDSSPKRACYSVPLPASACKLLVFPQPCRLSAMGFLGPILRIPTQQPKLISRKQAQ